jgi:hypothetical protein
MSHTLLDPESLARTVESVEDARLLGRKIRKEDRLAVIEFLSSRQGIEGSYHGLYAPTEADFAQEATLFTGEKLKSWGGKAHALGEEAMRALRWLGPKDPVGKAALKRGAKIIDRVRDEMVDSRRNWGEFCCGTCSIALLRNLADWDGDPLPGWRQAAIERIHENRDGMGRWRRFPFYYTLSALAELKLSGVAEEIQYAWSGLERAMSTLVGKSDPVSIRRRVLIDRLSKRL